MYRWAIKITLHNGTEIVGVSDSEKDNSRDAFHELMGNNLWREGVYTAIKNADNTGSIFVKTSEIDSMEIATYVKED